MKRITLFTLFFSILVTYSYASTKQDIVTNGYILAVSNGNLADLNKVAENANQYVKAGKTIHGDFCVASSVAILIPSNDINFYGDFIVSLTSNCKRAANQIMKSWENNKLLEVFKDSVTGPFPSVTLSN